MNDKAVSGRSTANPFRLPRLHPKSRLTSLRRVLRHFLRGRGRRARDAASSQYPGGGLKIATPLDCNISWQASSLCGATQNASWTAAEPERSDHHPRL